jgi:2-polyprenyl-6-methoxyphenol hydroxylase-like FAD-dependent oxidoreductase
MGESAQTQSPRREASCCVVGGEPAGMMLGDLLARAGVEVIVLEKHANFFRDFRGDTIHPSTLDLMAELGLLEVFLQLPHTRTPQLQATLDGKTFSVADFRHLPTRCKFIAMMPQWDFLNFIATEAKRYSTFRLEMHAEVTNILDRGNKIVGVRVATEQGELEVLADLIVAADGRHSTVRQQAGMSVREFRVPFDALWFRLPKNVDAPPTLGYFRDGWVAGTLDRGTTGNAAPSSPGANSRRSRHRGSRRSASASPAPRPSCVLYYVDHRVGLCGLRRENRQEEA